MNVVILGCGRSGSALALQLGNRGHNVVVIDRNPESFRRLGKNHPVKVVIGNGLDADALEKAKIREADVFVAMTRGDNTNLMAAQIAKLRYEVKRSCAKVADPNRAEAYRKLGLFCINASSLMAGLCLDWMLEEEYKPINTYNVLPPEQEVN
ncbi:MAG: potassium channel family protein [Fimbriimonadaceae bacterium]